MPQAVPTAATARRLRHASTRFVKFSIAVPWLLPRLLWLQGLCILRNTGCWCGQQHMIRQQLCFLLRRLVVRVQKRERGELNLTWSFVAALMYSPTLCRNIQHYENLSDLLGQRYHHLLIQKTFKRHTPSALQFALRGPRTSHIQQRSRLQRARRPHQY